MGSPGPRRMHPFAGAILCASLVWAASERAQAQDSMDSGAPSRILPRGPRVSRAYVDLLQKAVAQLVAREMVEAADPLREAKRLEPYQAAAYYYMGELLRMQGEREAALREYRHAVQVAAGTQLLMHGRALMGIALTLESMPERTNAARQAWEAYLQFTQTYPHVSFPATAFARARAVTLVEQLRHVDAEVRARIAERERVRNGTKQNGRSGAH
jgi:tetratricopeptide (TPR) repeat protein